MDTDPGGPKHSDPDPQHCDPDNSTVLIKADTPTYGQYVGTIYLHQSWHQDDEACTRNRIRLVEINCWIQIRIDINTDLKNL
jgi:hypothetical protein